MNEKKPKRTNEKDEEKQERIVFSVTQIQCGQIWLYCF